MSTSAYQKRAFTRWANAFLRLRKTEPALERPFRIGPYKIVGWLAVILSAGFVLLYFPGMPAALIWPYEWIILGGWILMGAVLYAVQKPVYQKEESSLSSKRS